MDSDHWPAHARQWHRVGPPLRPSREDLDAIDGAVARWTRAARRSPRVLLLGVTPEIATMPWPVGAALVAVDRCDGMIALVWPREGLPPGARAVRGDWRALADTDQSVDIVVADGSLSALAFPREYRTLSAEVRRVLCEDGLWIARLFVPSRAPDDVPTIAADLASGRIGNFHVLKWRLVQALTPPDGNVRLADVWDAWNALCPDPPALAAARGWPLETVATIDVYRGAPATYSFPALADVRDALGPGFDEIARSTPSYELGDRCPTVVWRRR